MKACVVHGPGELRIDEIEEPTIDAGQIGVRVIYGGICGSDLHYAKHGRNGDYEVREPLTLGHEVVGLIDQLGTDAPNGFKIGQRVAIHPAWPAPPAAQTIPSQPRPKGTYLGSASTTPHTQGAFAGHIAVYPDQIRELPDALPLKRAALAEPLAVAMHAVAQAGDAVVGARVLVSGAGPIGCLAIAALRAAGAASIDAADLTGHALKTATAVGADSIIPLLERSLEPDAYDVVFEAAGAPASLQSAIAAVRDGGLIIQLGVLPQGPLNIALAAIVSKEITIRGAQRFETELGPAVTLLAENEELSAIISHVFPLSQAVEAFHQASQPNASSKVLLKIADDPDDKGISLGS